MPDGEHVGRSGGAQMTTFIVTFCFAGSPLGACTWPMRIDATCAEDAVKACVAAHPGCAVVSVKVAERVEVSVKVAELAESNRATAGGTT